MSGSFGPHGGHSPIVLFYNKLNLNHHLFSLNQINGNQLADALFGHGHAKQALPSLSSALL